MNCKTCKARCVWAGKEQSDHGKCHVGYVPITNADRIRAMSDEELAGAFAQHLVELACRVASNFDCDIGAEKQFLLEQNKADWLQWLQSPAEGGEEDG